MRGRHTPHNIGRTAEVFCLFHFLCTIQVTGASAGNGAPHRAPPAALTSVQPHVEVCVCVRWGCHSASYQHFDAYVFVHIRRCVYFPVCVCVCEYIMTVILADRMITPFSPQLRGVAPLRILSLHPPPSKGAICFHICQSLLPLWVLQHSFASRSAPPSPWLPLSALSYTKHLNPRTLKNTCTL